MSEVAYTKLGSTGLDVSGPCLGCTNFGSARSWTVNDVDARVDLIHEAIDAGVNFLDTANVYSAGSPRRSSAPRSSRRPATNSSSPPRCTARRAKGRTAPACRAGTSSISARRASIG